LDVKMLLKPCEFGNCPISKLVGASHFSRTRIHVSIQIITVEGRFLENHNHGENCHEITQGNEGLGT
jgi:hypothetical protein